MLGVQSSGPVATATQAAGVRRVAESAIVKSSTCPEPIGARSLGEDPHAASAGRRDDAEERDAWVVLLTVPGLGPVTFAALLASVGSARATLVAAGGPNGAFRIQEVVADRTDDDSV